MRCRSVKERLVAWQDRELSPGEEAQVTEHLAQCADCAARERALWAVEPEDRLLVPIHIERELQRRLDAATASASPFPPARPIADSPRLAARWPWVAGALAIAAVLALWTLQPPASSEDVAAAQRPGRMPAQAIASAAVISWQPTGSTERPGSFTPTDSWF